MQNYQIVHLCKISPANFFYELSDIQKIYLTYKNCRDSKYNPKY